MYRPFVIAAALLSVPGCTARQAVVGPAPQPAFTTVTFERTPCFGTCPVYRVSVSGSGSVRFEGIRHVDSVGAFTSQIDAAAVAALGKAFEDAGYFSLDDRYTYGQANCREYGTDAATIRTSIAYPGRAKQVEQDLGCANPPAALRTLYERFDAIVGTAKWIGKR